MTLECSKQLRPYVEERVHDEMADLTMRWVMGERLTMELVPGG